MIEETFLNYRNYRWLWINLLVLGGMAAVYLWEDPIGGHNGGTYLGYTYGIFAAVAILYLLWFGIRKRAHYSKHTTLKGCLAVHVWLGVVLAVIVPLHCGFQFGLNVHTLAYVLMLGTIVSGIVGALIYLRLPTKILSHRGGGTVKALIEQIQTITSDIEWLARERSDHFLAFVDRVDFKFKPSILNALRDKKPAAVAPKEIATYLSKLPDTERTEALKVVGLTNRKRQLVDQIQDEVRVMAIFRTWLYVHVPIAYGCLMALSIHIFSVLYYN